MTITFTEPQKMYVCDGCGDSWNSPLFNFGKFHFCGECRNKLALAIIDYDYGDTDFMNEITYKMKKLKAIK